jgi:hypothetical protein
MKNKLKTCPFCGESFIQVFVYSITTRPTFGAFYAEIECPICKVKISTHAFWEHQQEKEVEALTKQWNTRAIKLKT